MQEMNATKADLEILAQSALGSPYSVAARLPGGGSTRAFYRLQGAGDPPTVIGVIGRNLAETRAFLGFTRHFAERGLPVPRIHGSDTARGLYLLEDLGDNTLARRIGQWREAPAGGRPVTGALERVVAWLAQFQVWGGAGLDYGLCWEGRELGGAVFRADLQRFLDHYLPRYAPRAPVPGTEVRGEMDRLLARLEAAPRDHFCYRDFQTRNVMWAERGGEEGPVFLDYQSGRRGPLAYDMASLLFSPDTGADGPLREHLIGVYLSALGRCGVDLSREEFLAGFYPLVLVRRLQALGAYAQLAAERGQRELEQRIPPALEDLRTLLAEGRFAFGLPALEAWLEAVLERA